MKTLLLIVAALLLQTYQPTAHADENESGMNTEENMDNETVPSDEKSEEEEGSGSFKDSEGGDDTEEQGSGSKADSDGSEGDNDEDDITEEDKISEESQSDDSSSGDNSDSDASKSSEDSGSDQSSDSEGSNSDEPESHECKHACWTPWFNRDDPSGSGDWETLENLYHEYPGMICRSPLRIQVKTKCGKNVSSTGNAIAVSDTRNGFVCKNSDQPSGSMCYDYKVRFLCPHEFCSPKICWTKWFTSDNPSGIVDGELLCDLRAENPGQICARPLHIEVRTRLNEAPAAFAGHTFYGTTGSCACSKCDQRKHQYHDYKVRFGCPCHA